MATRLPASQRTREELSALIEGRLRTAASSTISRVANFTSSSFADRWRGRPAYRFCDDLDHNRSR